MRQSPGIRIQVLASIVISFVGVCHFSCHAYAQGNVVMALDAMMVRNSAGSGTNPGVVQGQPGWGGFGRFDYGPIMIGTSSTLGPYDSFTLSEPGTAGSGVGINFTFGYPVITSPRDSFLGVLDPVTSEMFPLLDRATFGTNFDPNEYVAEIVYKPLPGNDSTRLNVTLDTADGFTDAGERRGEQWQWGFFDLINTYNNTQMNGDLDPDGFAVARSNMGVLSQAASNFNGQSHMYTADGSPLPASGAGDAEPDFNDFEGGPLPVPNGAVQIHLQTTYDTAAMVDNWEIKALRIVKLNPDPQEVARLDGHSGFGLRFGAPFENTTPINIGGTEYIPPNTDQLSRFDQNGLTNIVINTSTDEAIGGFGTWQSAATTVFDGTDATMEIRARLTEPLGAGQADSIQVVLKDRDGNDTGAAGDFGGDEYHFNVDLSQFNTSEMTTVSMRLDSANIEQGQEFLTPGDGMLSDFNLYYLGVLTNPGAGLVDLEIESIRVLLPTPPGITGDYNDNGVVDAADYVVWRKNLGTMNSLPNDATPQEVTQEDYDMWRANFGRTAGGGASLGQAAAVPEPGAWLLCGLAMSVLGVRLRRGR